MKYCSPSSFVRVFRCLRDDPYETVYKAQASSQAFRQNSARERGAAAMERTVTQVGAALWGGFHFVNQSSKAATRIVGESYRPDTCPVDQSAPTRHRPESRGLMPACAGGLGGIRPFTCTGWHYHPRAIFCGGSIGRLLCGRKATADSTAQQSRPVWQRRQRRLGDQLLAHRHQGRRSES